MTALATLRGLVRLAISNISSTASYALCENIEATTMYLRKVYWKSFTVDVMESKGKIIEFDNIASGLQTATKWLHFATKM